MFPTMADPASPTQANRARFARVDVIAVLLLALACTMLNVHWALLNQAPPASDDNSHLFASLDLVRQLATLPHPAQVISAYVLCPGYYPPLTYQVTCLGYGLLGVGQAASIASFFPFLAVLALSMYGIGVNLGGRGLGLACAVTALGAPIVVDHARTYFIDLPATAMLALSVFALAQSRGFARRGWSALFGLSMALGVLTRWTHLVFMLVLTLYAVGRLLWERRSPALAVAALFAALGAAGLAHVILTAPSTDTLFDAGGGFDWTPYVFTVAVMGGALAVARLHAARRPHLAPLLNLVESLAVFVLTAWPWYYYNSKQVQSKLLYQAGVHIDAAQSARAYLTDLSSMVWMAPLLLAVGAVMGLWQQRLRVPTALLLGSLATVLGTVSLLPPDPRYLLPAVVFVIPLALMWAAHLQPGAGARAGAGLLLVVSVVSLWQVTAFEWRRHGFEGLAGPTCLETRVGPDRQPLYLGLRPVQPRAPVEGSYPYDALLATLCLHETDRPLNLAVFETPEDAARFQPRSFLYHAALIGLSMRVFMSEESLRAGKLAEDVAQCRLILVVYSDTEGQRQMMALARTSGFVAGAPTPLATFRFSPRYCVELYRRSGTPAATPRLTRLASSRSPRCDP